MIVLKNSIEKSNKELIPNLKIKINFEIITWEVTHQTDEHQILFLVLKMSIYIGRFF
jgi:hypothetical protein